jgi:hypothetical protein
MISLSGNAGKHREDSARRGGSVGLSSTSVTPATAAGGHRAGRRPVRGRLAWAAGTVVVAVVLFAAYLLQSRTIPAGPDGASIDLLSWDMLHGNPLLRGWWVADVTFYTTELPQYMLLESARGLNVGLAHLGGAMTYTLLVLLAAFLARGRARGAAGVVRAVTGGAIMLAPQLGDGTQTLMQGPDHTGTAVPVLALFILIDWASPYGGQTAPHTPRGRRWWVPGVTALVLAWVLVGDALVIVIAAAPLAVVCLARACRGLVAREGLRAQWYELSMAAAAIVSVPVGLAAIKLITALGGWQIGTLQTKLATTGILARNFRITGQGLLELFGADFIGAGSTRAVVFAVLHLAGVALVVWGVCAAVRGFLRTDRLIEAVLLLAIVFDVAAYAFGVQVADLLSTREIAPVLPLGAALAGRLVGERLAARRVASAALAAGVACYAAMLAYGAAQPAQAPVFEDLTAWLTAHHLSYGLSGYTQANIVTVEGQGNITLRPAGPAGPGGRFLGARKWEANRSWYDPAQHRANFVVASTVGAAVVTRPEAIATFGQPARTYHYHEYTIMVWNGNLLDRLRS